MPLMGARWLPSLATGTLGTLTSSMITCGMDGNAGVTLLQYLIASLHRKETQSHMLFTALHMTLLHKDLLHKAGTHTSSPKHLNYEFKNNSMF